MNRNLFFDSYGLRMWVGVTTITLAVLALFALVYLLMFGYIAFYGVNACDNAWQDFVHEWHYFGGCLVEYEGTWYPDDVVRTLVQP